MVRFRTTQCMAVQCCALQLSVSVDPVGADVGSPVDYIEKFHWIVMY